MSGPGYLDRAFPRYGDGSTISDNPAELVAYNEYLVPEGQPPQDVAAVRRWYAARMNSNGGWG